MAWLSGPAIRTSLFPTEWVNSPERGKAYYSPSAYFSKLTHSVGHWLVRYCYKHHTEIRCKDKTIFAKYVVSPLLEGGQLLALLVKLIDTIKSVIQACLQMRLLNYSLIFSGLRSSITRLSWLKCCYLLPSSGQTLTHEKYRGNTQWKLFDA